MLLSKSLCLFVIVRLFSQLLDMLLFLVFLYRSILRADTLTQAHILSLSRTIYLCPSSEELHRARRWKIDK